MSSIEHLKNSSLATMCFLDDETRARLIAGDKKGGGGFERQARKTKLKLNGNVVRIFGA
jgi:hypothetical protein